MEKRGQPYGTWRAPVTSELGLRHAVRLGDLAVDGDEVLGSEDRSAEGGRTEIVRRPSDRTTVDLLGPGFNARTAVHEYGGGAWWARGGAVWFANWSDQRL